MELKQLLGANVKRLRQARGLTQTELAAELRVALQTVFTIESGSSWLRETTLDSLAKSLGVEPWQLLAPPGAAPAREPTVEEALAVLARAHGFALGKV